LPDAAQLEQFRRDGHVLIRGLLDPALVRALRPGIRAAFERNRPTQDEVSRPRTAYEEAFVQVVNMGLREPEVRALTWSPVLGAVAAALLGVEGVRIFVEDAMFKEPGRGHTPWHQDGSCLPMEPRRMITAWVPLVPTGLHAGRLRFVPGSQRLGHLGPVDISEETDAAFGRLIAEQGLAVAENPPMEPGDVSFHDGATIHGALPNTSGEMRELMAIHYFVDGARIGLLDNDTRRNLVQHLAPELQTGDPAQAAVWPLVHRRTS